MNCTIVGNHTNASGGGIGSPGEGLGPLTLTNCIVWGHWDDNGTPYNPHDDFGINVDYHLKSQAGRWDAVSETWVQDQETSPSHSLSDVPNPTNERPGCDTHLNEPKRELSVTAKCGGESSTWRCQRVRYRIREKSDALFLHNRASASLFIRDNPQSFLL